MDFSDEDEPAGNGEPGFEFDVPGKFSPAAEVVYLFSRKSDLSPSGKKKKKSSAAFQAKPAINTYLAQRPRCQFYQAPLNDFHKWYQDYQFASLLMDNSETGLVWEYR
jgi:hypothetical protein